MNLTVSGAINGLRVLRLNYDGYHRLVEPHAYGSTKEGNDVMRVWQTAGGSVHNEPVGWKLLRLDETTGIQATGDSFAGAHQGYKRGDKAMSTIYAQL